MIIGISAGRLDGAHRVVSAYTECIADAGAIPMILPVTTDRALLRESLLQVDGLLMIGGGDIHPRYWGEELTAGSNPPDEVRDVYDMTLVELAAELCLPTLGICRGMQAMNIGFGGDIFQDMYIQQPEADLIEHMQVAGRDCTSHTVGVMAGSLLREITGRDTLEVNSFHHQAVRAVAQGWIASGIAEDGTVEAIERQGYKMIGVQWHPEELYRKDESQKAIFAWLKREAEIYRQAKEIHRQVCVTDTHTDTPMVWTSDTDLGTRHSEDEIKVDFRKTADGRIGALFMVAYLPQTAAPTDADYSEKATEACNTATDIIDRLKREVERNGTLVTLGGDEIKTPCEESRTQIYFGLENGFALAGDVDNVDRFYAQGVRYITLCHNGDNDLCDSAKGVGTHGGLSAFGRKVIERMNSLGMMVDVSHAADSTIRQAIEYSRQPVIATHTSSYALCPHPRNMSDETVRLLAQSGGRIHVCLYNYFLEQDGQADIESICRHIDHLVGIAGVEHVGVGSDFDGGGGVPGCNDESQLIMITSALLRRGYKPEDVGKIMGSGFRLFYNQFHKKDNSI